MPPSAERALEQDSLLYVQQRSADRRYSVSTRWSRKAQRSPFHLNCTLPVSFQSVFRVQTVAYGQRVTRMLLADRAVRQLFSCQHSPYRRVAVTSRSLVVWAAIGEHAQRVLPPVGTIHYSNMAAWCM